MNYWNETPLFRFLLLFICGIVFAIYFPVLNLIATLLCCCSLILLLFLQFLFRKKFQWYRRRWLAGAMSYVASFLSGYVLTGLNTEKKYPEHFRNFQNVSCYIGYLDQPASEKAKSFKTVIRVLYVSDNNQWKCATGNCLAYLLKDSLSSILKYGDLILFTAKPVEVPLPANPSQFDYKRWLGFNKIFDQVYIDGKEWKLIERDCGNQLSAFSYRLRDQLLEIFGENFITGQDYAVLSALILGYEDDIDQETINAYAASGALHILSVSGMHVGIIYIALNFFLGFLDRNRKTRLLKSTIVILFLWFYALLTGLSPSVLRSATMLSFIVIGQMKRQYTNLYNTLAASAFFLLGLNPFLIMQVGFQLSYMAVLGIIFLQPSIQAWLDPRNWLLRQVWSIVAVSLAAQLATFPLGLLYFHQFPVYFLISNLVVIPISTIIIYGGIFLLIVSWWSAVAGITGILLGYIVHYMNAIALFIEQLPCSLIAGISISVFETWITYGSIGAIVLFFISREQKYLLITMATFVLVLASQVIESRSLKEQKQLVIYTMKGRSFINIIDGSGNYVWTDSASFQNRSLGLFNVYHYWWDCGHNEYDARELNNPSLCQPGCTLYKSFLLYENYTIAVVKDSAMLRKNCGKTVVDFLILSNNVKTKIVNLVNHFKFKHIIIDSSNSMSRASRWMDEARRLGIEAYSVQHRGAFVCHLLQE